MITRAEIEKLGAVHAVAPAILSVYLTVPSHPGQPGALAARGGGLIAAAQAAVGGPGCLSDEDRDSALEMLADGARDWPGQTVAVFACADVGLLEAVPLPCRAPDKAVLGTRPHIRPLLAALQRCPAYRVAVADAHHVWLLAIAGDEIQTVPAWPTHCSEDWPGLPPDWVREPINWLTAHSYHDAAAVLNRVAGPAGSEPLVIIGHGEGIERLLTGLSPAVRATFAGGATDDAPTLTPAQVRDLAVPVVARWADEHARQVADEIRAMRAGRPACPPAIGLQACLAAVTAGGVDTLVVPLDELVPGYECGRCGALSTGADSCPDWGTAPLPVPDVLEEMVSRTLEDGGQVLVTSDYPYPMAAGRRSPAAGAGAA
jgi:Bacterial archaeo-eukaryotic release factor family 10